MITVNAMGDNCPIPVIKTQNAIKALTGPEEVEVLSQDTKEEREVTLITCTFGAVKRIVVKASEVYD